MRVLAVSTSHKNDEVVCVYGLYTGSLYSFRELDIPVDIF